MTQLTATQSSDAALRLFVTHFVVDLRPAPEHVLRQVIANFARLPYENLTKILKEASVGSSEQARRGPAEVIGDHISLGTGGTCFSLTAALLQLLRSLGWQAEPILADRPYAPDTHCAVRVRIAGRPHLVDPGYLLTEPIPLQEGSEQRIPTSFHQVLLKPRQGEGKLELHTIQGDQTTQRLTYKTDPVDWQAFVKVWDASFGWDMMRDPLLTRVASGEHLYLRSNRLQTRTSTGITRTEIAPAELVSEINERFGINPSVTARALALLKRKGEKHG